LARDERRQLKVVRAACLDGLDLEADCRCQSRQFLNHKWLDRARRVEEDGHARGLRAISLLVTRFARCSEGTLSIPFVSMASASDSSMVSFGLGRSGARPASVPPWLNEVSE
jgi:hypothetical protein